MLRDPAYANPISIRFLPPEKSATAPRIGSTATCSRTERATTYGKKDPAWTGMPSGYTNPRASAAARVTAVRCGPRKTVTTVVENAEFPKSYAYQPMRSHRRGPGGAVIVGA